MEVCVMKKIVVGLDSDLYEEVLAEAKAQDISAEELIRDWVEDHMIQIREEGSDQEW